MSLLRIPPVWIPLLLSLGQQAPRAPQLPGPATPAAPPPQMMNETLMRAAVDFAKQPVVPIPIDPEASISSTSQKHGVVFDRFLLGQLVAKANAAAGMPINPLAPPRGFMPIELVVVAFPLRCAGAVNAPRDIQMSMTTGKAIGPVKKIGAAVSGSQLSALLPGAQLPAGAVAQVFGSVSFQQGAVVKMTYAAPACPSPSPMVTLPLKLLTVPAVEPVSVLKLPAGSKQSSPTVVQAFIVMTPDGNISGAVNAPSGLDTFAMAAIKKARYQPNRVNGTPIASSMLIKITFTSDGLPPRLASSSAQQGNDPSFRGVLT
jgi:hypothetical protein